MPRERAAESVWEKVAADVIARIESGETPVGSEIASTQQLATRHGTSANTAQKAITHLKRTGLLEGRTGVGVFVLRAPGPADLAPSVPLERRVAQLEREVAELREQVERLVTRPPRGRRPASE